MKTMKIKFTKLQKDVINRYDFDQDYYPLNKTNIKEAIKDNDAEIHNGNITLDFINKDLLIDISKTDEEYKQVSDYYDHISFYIKNIKNDNKILKNLLKKI